MTVLIRYPAIVDKYFHFWCIMDVPVGMAMHFYLTIPHLKILLQMLIILIVLKLLKANKDVISVVKLAGVIPSAKKVDLIHILYKIN